MSTQQPSVARASVVMFLYAALILTFGIMAYLIAPSGEAPGFAIGAIVVSSLLMTTMGMMSLMIHKNRRVGMVGIHVGLVLPLVLAAIFLWRGGHSYRSSGVFQHFENAYRAEVSQGHVADNSDGREGFLAKAIRAEEIPKHDLGYLGFILTMLFGVSVAAFVVLLLSRPELPPKPAPVAVAPDDQSSKAAPTDSKGSAGDAGGFD